MKKLLAGLLILNSLSGVAEAGILSVHKDNLLSFTSSKVKCLNNSKRGYERGPYVELGLVFNDNTSTSVKVKLFDSINTFCHYGEERLLNLVSVLDNIARGASIVRETNESFVCLSQKLTLSPVGNKGLRAYKVGYNPVKCP